MKPSTYPTSGQDAQAIGPLTKVQRILIVDDEEHIALMLQEGLAKLPNCEITAVTNSDQVLPLFAQRPFDLLITDYKMPGIDGVTLANQVRQHYPETPVILLSAYPNEVIEAQAGEMTIQHILDKPIKLVDIRQVTLEALEKKACVLADYW